MNSNMVRISERPAMPASFLRMRQRLADFVVPATLPHELVPNVDLVGRLAGARARSTNPESPRRFLLGRLGRRAES